MAPGLADDGALTAQRLVIAPSVEDFDAHAYPLADPVTWQLNDAVLACDAPAWSTGQSGISYAPGFPAKPRRELPGDIDRGDCPPYRYRLSDCERAGKPHCVAWWAATSVNKHYSAGYVGGGTAIGGRNRLPAEGIWGLDYHGANPLHRVWLKWTCGRVQGGEGAYQTDGRTGPLSRH